MCQQPSGPLAASCSEVRTITETSYLQWFCSTTVSFAVNGSDNLVPPFPSNFIRTYYICNHVPVQHPSSRFLSSFISISNLHTGVQGKYSPLSLHIHYPAYHHICILFCTQKHLSILLATIRLSRPIIVLPGRTFATSCGPLRGQLTPAAVASEQQSAAIASEGLATCIVCTLMYVDFSTSKDPGEAPQQHRPSLIIHCL